MSAATKRCSRRGCEAKATKKIQPAYARPWFGCEEHYPAMQKALSVGQPAEREATVTPVSSKKDRAPHWGLAPAVVRLDWSSRSKTPGSWHFRTRPCVTCGVPTFLRNPEREHQHKACAERELERALAS